jgi:Matrixin
MMKKITLALMITVILLTPVVLAKNEKQTEPLDKITFIHYNDGTVKVIGGAANSPACYKLLGVQWKTLPVSYVINPGSYDSNFLTDAISAATKTWDDATSKSLFNGYFIDSSATQEDSANQVDYKNEYVFGDYPNSNVIAITNIWYTRYGKQIVDYDVLFNTYYNWFDCTKTACTSANKGMDLQNIATHETGHGLGLSDIYSSKCSAVTMYGYSSYGETTKRTLEPSDKTGLQKIYGA